MPKFSLNGVPDIIMVYRRAFVGFEVKRPTGKQSEHQVAFQQLVESAGGFYFLVTCIEDVINAMKKIDLAIGPDYDF